MTSIPVAGREHPVQGKPGGTGKFLSFLRGSIKITVIFNQHIQLTMKYLLLFTFALFLGSCSVPGNKEQIAPAPPMGWNSWNWFGKNEVNEEIIRECIDAIADNGLKDAGYEYVVIDGGWRDTILGPDGELLPHPVKFPHGIKVLADYAHSRGLKFGLHTVPGMRDCGGDKVGGYGHEEVQLQQFVDWGVDFIKLDRCGFQGGWNEDVLREVYFKWHHLIENCGREIFLSVNVNHFRDWCPEICQMARTTDDIMAHLHGGAEFVGTDRSILGIAHINNESAAYAGNGYWNDPDMMVTGDPALTNEEQQVHFALWCIMSAPLILGDDPRNMTQEEKDIVLNKRAISIDQDPKEQGKLVEAGENYEIWVKNLSDKNKAVLIINKDSVQKLSMDLSLEELGIGADAELKEVYTGEPLENNAGHLSAAPGPHSGLFFITSM